jgi:hypothetical protein
MGSGQPEINYAEIEARNLRAQMERMREQMFHQQAEVERDRRDLELQKMRDEQELRLREMASKMELALAQTREHRAPEKPAFDPAALLTSAAPILAAFIQSQNTTREMMARQQQESQQQFQQLMASLMNRPAVDPQVQAIYEKMAKRDDGDAGARMMHTMMESMSTMQANYVDMISTLADFGLGGQRGEEEPVAMKAIRQAVKAMSSMMTGVQQSAAVKQPPGQQAQQLPPGQPAPQHAPQAQQAPQQATVHPFPRVAEGSAPQPKVIDRIEALIRAKAPTSEVVDAIFQNLMDPSVQQAFEEANGEFEEWLGRRLGDWVTEENSAYLRDVIDAVHAKAEELGFADAEGEGESGDEETKDDFDD